MTKKQKVLKALEETKGIVTDACKKAGISRALFYQYMNKDEKFKQQVEDVQEATIDFVESKLLKNINSDNVTAQIFYLKTKAKHRGYVERQEIQNEHSGSIQFEFN